VLLGGRGMFRKALAIYAAAFVVVAVIARAAIVGIGLPEWVFAGSLVVMALGLPVVLWTGYVQRVTRHAILATPTYTPGGTPTTNQGTIATMALRAAPHMSWYRTARGGMYAFGAFIAFIALFMGMRAAGIGPFGSLFAAGRLNARDPLLLGVGESSDAHHMSTPHPEGRGARLALQAALDRAQLTPADIDYINLHGTASQKNDEVEAQLVAELFPARTFASSTKGWTGHALGAAGIVEAAISLLAIEHGLLPGTLNSQTLDPVCGPQIRRDNEERATRTALSFSFGFGGSNCVLAFGRAA